MLTIRGSGDVNISINDAQVLSLNLEADHTIIIDSFGMNAYGLDGAFLNRHVVGDYENIKLNVGKNTISFDGDVTSISVKNYSRWI
jgi:phage-related protein